MPQLHKIALNGTYIQQQASGLGVVNSNLIAELMKCDRQFEFTLYSHADDWQTQYPERVVPVTPALSPDRGLSGHLKRIFWYQTTLREQLKPSTDLLFSPVAEGIFSTRIPQIITVHDLIPLKYPELSPKWRYYYLYVLPLLLRQSRRIICVSQHTKQDVVETYKIDATKIDVVYWGCDRNLFFPQRDPEILRQYNLDKYLLYVGDMRSYKNLDRCLEAFDRLPFSDCQFVITGKKDDFFYPQIERQVSQLSAKERIIFLDYVPTHELPVLYSMARSLLFASLYEGFGLPVLEAMACGCPVIASKATSIPEVGGDSVLYVDPYDVESITQAMYEILTNNELRTSQSRRGLKRAQLFSWQKSAQNICQIFEELLSTESRDNCA